MFFIHFAIKFCLKLVCWWLSSWYTNQHKGNNNCYESIKDHPNNIWLGWTLWNICVTNDQGYVPLVVITSWSFSHSCKTLVKQELPTLPEHLSSPPVFSGVCVTRSLVLCVCFIDGCLSFCFFFLLAIVLSVLQFTDSDYHFGIFKLFFEYSCQCWDPAKRSCR